MAAPESSAYRHPQQPPLIWGDLKKPWEQVVKDGPDWRSGQFPPLPERAEYEGRYKFQGFDLMSPISIAAGPASGKLWTDFYFKMGYGLVFEKTRRTVERVSNLAPNIAIIKSEAPITRETLGQTLEASLDPEDWNKYRSMTNSFGNPSPPMSVWSSELRLQRESVGEGQVLGCSVTATTPDDDVSCSAIIGENPEPAVIVETASDLLTVGTAAATNGAQIIEFNMACPNVTKHPEEGEMFQSRPLVAYTFARFKQAFPNIPAGMKVGVYKNSDQMRGVFASAGDNMGYVSIINAIAMGARGADGNDILPGRRQTGVAGRVDQRIALEQIEWAAKIREQEGLKYQIIGGGGITETSDPDMYLNAGADIVFIAANAIANPLMAYEYRRPH